jgi:hypothetical protein
MSQPRFLADEDLRRAIVLAVRRLEPAIEIPTIFDMNVGGASDEQVLELAAGQGFIVVSHDVNTMRAAAETRLRNGSTMAGLFLVPQTRTTRVVAEALSLIWSASTAEEWAGRIVYLPL